VVTLDLSRTDTLPLAVSDVLARRGHIDMLINNGGVSQRALAQDASLAVERALMEVNYFGPVALTKSLLPFMLKRASGHIVVVSSVMGYVGTPGRSTYAAAKHALHGWFDSLRAEIWRHGVKVSIICPGYVRTAVSANAVGALGEAAAQRVAHVVQVRGDGGAEDALAEEVEERVLAGALGAREQHGDAGAAPRALDDGGEVVEEPRGVVVAAVADHVADVFADERDALLSCRRVGRRRKARGAEAGPGVPAQGAGARAAEVAGRLARVEDDLGVGARVGVAVEPDVGDARDDQVLVRAVAPHVEDATQRAARLGLGEDGGDDSS
jgi:short-subunit dehydrogenase involved in D-alanine esterification of teichoic acids